MLEVDKSLFCFINNLISIPNSKDRGLIIHISGTKLRLLELADEMGFTKQTRNGMRNFNVGSLDDFVYKGMIGVFDDCVTAWNIDS